MKKQDVIKKLEEVIEFVKDDNHYVVNVYTSESPDIEPVKIHGDGAEIKTIGLMEVGKRMDIDIHVEYVESKFTKMEGAE